jgi:hypothetical protein
METRQMARKKAAYALYRQEVPSAFLLVPPFLARWIERTENRLKRRVQEVIERWKNRLIQRGALRPETKNT